MEYEVARRIIPTISGKQVSVGDIVTSEDINSDRAERFFLEGGYLTVRSADDPEMATVAAITAVKRARGRPTKTKKRR